MLPLRLEKLERVLDLREAWPTEAGDFTPWLALEQNIDLLGKAIGVELEVVQTEAFVGPYRADIHCRDVLTGDTVLVENQLERTDHTHLGQLFTYAAGLDAKTVVWIAKRFTEEHRAALDWLNGISHADFRFFGIEVELWRIGASAHAPKFNVVARPNDWAKTVLDVTAAKHSERSPSQTLYADYWQGLTDLILDRGSPIRPPTAKSVGNYWVWFPVGKTNYYLTAYTNGREGRIGVSLTLETPDALSGLDTLALDAVAIEEDLGFAVTWDRDESRRSQAIRVRLDVDTTAPARWPDLHAWTLDRLEAFDRVFRPRIRLL